jgi:large subunit ribosomal protein L24
MPSMSIRKNDEVVVRAGKDRGKRGRVLMVIADKNRVVIEGATPRRTPRRTSRAGSSSARRRSMPAT